MATRRVDAQITAPDHGARHQRRMSYSAACPKSCRRGEIALLTSRNRRNSEKDTDVWNQRGTVMTITGYLAATIMVALILWVVLGLLMQES
jgi:hypothetical protein